jgi:phosphohistidine phosphatase
MKAGMRRLILLRHAKAERRAASGEDFDRALTGDGRHAAAAAGEALARAGLIPDVALVSPAVRTRQTFEAAASSLPDVRLELRRDLYEASAATLRQAAESCDGETVLLVGHNPGVAALAAELGEACTVISIEDQAVLREGFATATAAAFEITAERTACLGVFRPAGIAG